MRTKNVSTNCNLRFSALTPKLKIRYPISSKSLTTIWSLRAWVSLLTFTQITHCHRLCLFKMVREIKFNKRFSFRNLIYKKKTGASSNNWRVFIFDQPLVLLTEIINQLEPCYFQELSWFLCLQERHERFVPHNRLHSGHCYKFFTCEANVGMCGLD